MRKLTTLLAMAAALLSFPALADEPLAPPEGCEAFVTVQMQGCQTSLLWRCDMAPKGDIWDASFGLDGLESIINYDGEFQWIAAEYMWDGSREELIEPSEDAISMSELLDTGIDTFAFLLTRTARAEGRSQLRVIGADQLTGEEVEIDGVRLLPTNTEYRIFAEDGSQTYHVRSRQYVSPEMGVFFLGLDRVIEGSETREFDNSPVDFIFPGEPGFGNTTPLYGCEWKKAGFSNGLGRHQDAG